MGTNLFQKAKAKANDKTKSPAKKAKEVVEIEDLRKYAAIQAIKKAIETMESTLKASVNEQVLEYFVENRTDKSFDGADDDTTASCQIRKRSSRSTLSEQEVKILSELGISIEKSKDCGFRINNKYAEDDKLLARVSKALEGVKGIPEDFIEATPEKYVTTETSISEALRKVKDSDQLRDVLCMVGVIATRPKFGGSHEDMMEILEEAISQ